MLRRIQVLLNTNHHEVIIRPFMQNYSSTIQLTSPISSENLIQSRLGEVGLQSVDVGGAGNCFFRSVSHQLYGNSNHHMHIRTAGVQFYERQPREIYWEQYRKFMAKIMCIQGTWADALIIQAVADALKVFYTNLLFIENVSITYNTEILIVSKIN